MQGQLGSIPANIILNLVFSFTHSAPSLFSPVLTAHALCIVRSSLRCPATRLERQGLACLPRALSGPPPFSRLQPPSSLLPSLFPPSSSLLTPHSFPAPLSLSSALHSLYLTSLARLSAAGQPIRSSRPLILALVRDRRRESCELGPSLHQRQRRRPQRVTQRRVRAPSKTDPGTGRLGGGGSVLC